MSDQERNRSSAIDFYKTAYLGDPARAVDQYAGQEYVQHNPLVADGKEAFVEYFERMALEHPEKTIEFVRSVSEGDLVALHTHQVWPGDGEYVTMDFFRFDASGKIVEHWDSIQTIPVTSANQNSMF